MTRLGCEFPRPSVERCPGHHEIPGNLRSGLAIFDQTESVSNLAVCDPARPTAEVLSSLPPFADRIIDAFTFDLVLHLRGSGLDREQR